MKPCILLFPVTICYIICGISGAWQSIGGRGLKFRGLGSRTGDLNLGDEGSATGYFNLSGQNNADVNYISSGDRDLNFVKVTGVEAGFDIGGKDSDSEYYNLGLHGVSEDKINGNEQRNEGLNIGGGGSANGYFNFPMQGDNGDGLSDGMHSSEEEDHDFNIQHNDPGTFNIGEESTDDGNINMITSGNLKDRLKFTVHGSGIDELDPNKQVIGGGGFNIATQSDGGDAFKIGGKDIAGDYFSFPKKYAAGGFNVKGKGISSHHIIFPVQGNSRGTIYSELEGSAGGFHSLDKGNGFNGRGELGDINIGGGLSNNYSITTKGNVGGVSFSEGQVKSGTGLNVGIQGSTGTGFNIKAQGQDGANIGTQDITRGELLAEGQGKGCSCSNKGNGSPISAQSNSINGVYTEGSNNVVDGINIGILDDSGSSIHLPVQGNAINGLHTRWQGNQERLPNIGIQNGGGFNIGWKSNFNYPVQGYEIHSFYTKGQGSEGRNPNIAIQGQVGGGNGFNVEKKAITSGYFNYPVQGNAISGHHAKGNGNEGEGLNVGSQNGGGGGFYIGAKSIANGNLNYPAQGNANYGTKTGEQSNEGRGLNIGIQDDRGLNIDGNAVTNAYFNYPVQGNAINAHNAGGNGNGGESLNVGTLNGNGGRYYIGANSITNGNFNYPAQSNTIDGFYVGGQSNEGKGLNKGIQGDRGLYIEGNAVTNGSPNSYFNYPTQGNVIYEHYVGDRDFNLNGNRGKDLNIGSQGGGGADFNFAKHYYNLPVQESIIQAFYTGDQSKESGGLHPGIQEGGFNIEGKGITSSYNKVVNSGSEIKADGGSLQIDARGNVGVSNIEGKPLPVQAHLINHNLPWLIANSNRVPQSVAINGKQKNDGIYSRVEINGNGGSGFYFIPNDVVGCGCKGGVKDKNTAGNLIGNVGGPSNFIGFHSKVQGIVEGGLESNAQTKIGGSFLADDTSSNFEGKIAGKGKLNGGVQSTMKNQFEGHAQANIEDRLNTEEPGNGEGNIIGKENPIEDLNNGLQDNDNSRFQENVSNSTDGGLVTGELNNFEGNIIGQDNLLGDLNGVMQSNIQDSNIQNNVQANIVGGLNIGESSHFEGNIVGQGNLKGTLSGGLQSNLEGGFAGNGLMNIGGGFNRLNINSAGLITEGPGNFNSKIVAQGNTMNDFSALGHENSESGFKDNSQAWEFVKGINNFEGGINGGGIGMFNSGVNTGWFGNFDGGIIPNWIGNIGEGFTDFVGGLNTGGGIGGHIGGTFNVAGGINTSGQGNLKGYVQGIDQSNIGETLNSEDFGHFKGQLNLIEKDNPYPFNKVVVSRGGIFDGPRGYVKKAYKDEAQGNVDGGLNTYKFKEIGNRLDAPNDGKFKKIGNKFNGGRFLIGGINAVGKNRFKGNVKDISELALNSQAINAGNLNAGFLNNFKKHSDGLGYSKGEYKLKKFGPIGRQMKANAFDKFRSGFYSERFNDIEGRLAADGYSKVYRG